MDITALYLAAALLGHPIQEHPVDNTALQRLTAANDAQDLRNRINNAQREQQREIDNLNSRLNAARLGLPY
jgi:hypothetical protein